PLDGKWSSDGETLAGAGGHLATVDELGDFTFDVDISVAAGPIDRTVGVGVRGRDIIDPAKAQGYAVNFTNNTYNAFKGTAGKWLPVNRAFTACQPTPLLVAGTNHVSVRATGGRFAAFVNGQPLIEWQDASYERGKLHFWVESTATTVRFANLKIVR